MSRVILDLCSEILKLHYGDIVSSVGMYLLRKKTSNLATISRNTSLDVKQTKEAICVLIQQNIVRFKEVKGGAIEYEATVEEVLYRLRFPHYIHCAKKLYGDAAELLVEELLLQGQTTLASVVDKTTRKLNESIASNGSTLPEIGQNVVGDKVITLIKARLIRRCEDVVKNKENKAVAIDNCCDPESLFQLPSSSEFDQVTHGAKRSGDDNVSVPSKRIKLEGGDNQPIKAESGDHSEQESGPKVWCINVYQFHHHFRDQAIISAVAKTIDQKASEVMRTMLRLSETKTIPTAQESEELSFTEICSAIPKDKLMTRDTVDQYLRCLAENCHNFVTRVGESGGGMFKINFFKAIRAICVSQIKTIVLERFGSKALRIFHVMMLKKNVEQKQVEEQAMLTPKEAKELLYTMFAENFVSITELSKTPDHAPARTFYLFNVNLIQLARLLLEKCYQTMLNVKIKRDKFISENKRLLDKQERVETIIASLDAEGAIEQKEEVEQMVTPAEKNQLRKVSHATKQLEMSEVQLNDTIFILETFLAYSLNPPPPKR